MTPNSAFVWGAGGARMTPEQIESQKKVAQALMDKGMDYSPIQSPWQGAARVAQALMGGFKDAEATEAGRANDAADKEMLASLMGGGSSGGDKTDSVPNAGVQPMTDSVPNAGVQPMGSVPNAGVQPMGSVPNAGVQPMARLPPMSSRIYEEHEFNPIDAMNATPEELAAGVRAPKQYAALIGKAAVDNDLPPELIVALIKQESGFNPNAVSSAGAQGIAQFMPETAREMGVNPLDPASAIPGAAKYLRQNIDKFGGSIPLGLAAYNAGPGRVERSGGDISRLPAETQGYVRNITRNITGAAPVRTAQASPMAGVNPKVLEAATSRYSSPQTKTIANIILQQQMQANKPSDYYIQQRPDGSIIAINKKDPNDLRVLNAPGAGAAAIKFEADKAAAVEGAKLRAAREVTEPDKRKQEKLVGDIITTDIDRAIKLVDSATLPTTGMVGSFLSNIGGTAARDVRALVDTVKANAGFQELNKMRAASPTGGALGSITERELALLQATIGNLEQSQTADQFKDNLRRVKNVYMDIIHGEGKGPQREKLMFQEMKAKPAIAPPQVGEIKDGYRFKGGNAADRGSWERVN